jgi:hypothetical protein
MALAIRRASDPRAASRAFAIANALEGLSRAEAARWPGWSARRCAMPWSAIMRKERAA